MTQIAPQCSLADATVSARAGALLQAHQQKIWGRTDRLFAGLLLFEWLGGIALAWWRSPRTWDGALSHIHPHVWAAIFLGAIIIALPLYLTITRPGLTSTRQVIAMAQMLISALLIHLGDGRIEMHFHVFGSLAFLAFYRDWRVLITASAVVAADHILRGYFLPQSVYGDVTASSWRWIEHAAWVVFEDLFLIISCIQGVREMRGIAERQALLESSHRTVEEKVRALVIAQQNIVKVARSAGMVEVATGVLHNVGNVLNSVNVTAATIADRVRQSRVSHLALAADLVRQHEHDFGDFVTNDARGRQLPQFLIHLSEHLGDETARMDGELRSLIQNIEHIKEIVNLQQSYGQAGGIIEEASLIDLIEDSLRINMAGLERHDIDLVRDYTITPRIFTDRHKVIQILVNLISNAKYAMEGRGNKRLTIRVAALGPDRVTVSVTDSGMGIPPDNLTRIFSHGFTTRKGGHGFGLHSSANVARTIGGMLTAHSGGPGAGATFTLELPRAAVAQPTEELQPCAT
jgi:signal transduction histidine kinase